MGVIELQSQRSKNHRATEPETGTVKDCWCSLNHQGSFRTVRAVAEPSLLSFFHVSLVSCWQLQIAMNRRVAIKYRLALLSDTTAGSGLNQVTPGCHGSFVVPVCISWVSVRSQPRIFEEHQKLLECNAQASLRKTDELSHKLDDISNDPSSTIAHFSADLEDLSAKIKDFFCLVSFFCFTS